MAVIWSKRAKKDLAGIWEYYSSRNMPAAVKIMRGIRASSFLLSDNPRIAPVEPKLEGLSQEFRSMVVRKLHEIVYSVDGDTANIITIWDCRRNPDTLRRIASRNPSVKADGGEI